MPERRVRVNFLIVIAITYTVVSVYIRLDRWLEVRRDARRRNQAHPWR